METRIKFFSIKENKLKTPKSGKNQEKNQRLRWAKYLSEKFLEIHRKDTSVYCSKAMFDGRKLESFKFF